MTSYAARNYLDHLVDEGLGSWSENHDICNRLPENYFFFIGESDHESKIVEACKTIGIYALRIIRWGPGQSRWLNECWSNCTFWFDGEKVKELWQQESYDLGRTIRRTIQELEKEKENE